MTLSLDNYIKPVFNSPLSTFTYQGESSGVNFHLVWISEIRNENESARIYINPFDYSNKALVHNKVRLVENNRIALIYNLGVEIIILMDVSLREQISKPNVGFVYKNGPHEYEIKNSSRVLKFYKLEGERKKEALEIVDDWYSIAYYKFFPAS